MQGSLPLLLPGALLCALLYALPATAADDDATPEPAAPLSESEQEAAIAAEIAAAEAAEAARGNDSTAANAPLNDNENFVPSVQISEDLSVSFPVDI